MAKSSETWVVTGASRGIGLEYVKQLLAAGAIVMATVRSIKSSPGLQALQAQYGDRLTVVTMDVGDFASIKTAATEVDAAHPGGIDFLVANAGIATVKQDNNTPDIELDPEEFDEFFHVNVAGLFATIKAFYPLLKKKEGGRKTVLTMSSAVGIISQASTGARQLDKPLGLTDGIMLAYKASKTAVTQITAQLAQGLKSEGFTFVAMHPGLVQTNAGDGLISRAKSTVGEETASKFYITPEVSVGKQLEYLATVTQEKDNGRFVNYTSEDLPW